MIPGGDSLTAKPHAFQVGGDGQLTETGRPFDTGVTAADDPSSVLVPAQAQAQAG
ncbi:hypothetical protein G3I51_32120 [Streptomyces sp. SID9944]|jgi:hypothetical protein|nr:hypothetical protein [Streptomyces sp. SID9944]